MPTAPAILDSSYSWRRLAVSVLLATVGNVGLWSFVVVLPTVQTDFGASRGEVSVPYTLVSVGFAFGGLMMGRLSDLIGMFYVILLGATLLCAGYLLSAFSANVWQLALVHGLLIGVGSSATFAPMMADVSHWFLRHRGIAIAIAASGNYLAGTVWPPILQYAIATQGWRTTHAALGIFCFCVMVPLAFTLRRRAEVGDISAATSTPFTGTPASLGLSPLALQTLLIIAGVSCCVAMAMPQVHIVAYCADLGYGIARGAEMLSIMLGFGIVSRIASGFIADRIGGLGTLMVGSVMQAAALLLYMAFDGLMSLYIISAVFGLFQGGIVPSYAIVIREYFSPKEAGTRVGIVVMATLFGMAFGGWLSGVIFDWTGSYHAAFAHGVGWNVLNIAIAGFLLIRARAKLLPA